MPALIMRVTLGLLLPFVVIYLFDAMPGVSASWDFANVAGFLGGAIFLLLFIYTGLPKPTPHYEGKFFLRLHRDLGWGSAVLLALHVGILLFTEPLLLGELIPGASWYLLAGYASTLLLIVSLPLSLGAVRRKVWKRHASFRVVHYYASVLIVLFAALHMIGAAYYAGTWIKMTFWAGLSLAAVIVPYWSKGAEKKKSEGGRLRKESKQLSVSCLGNAFSLARGLDIRPRRHVESSPSNCEA